MRATFDIPYQELKDAQVDVTFRATIEDWRRLKDQMDEMEANVSYGAGYPYRWVQNMLRGIIAELDDRTKGTFLVDASGHSEAVE